MKRKIKLCIFILLLVISLTGCGVEENNTNNNVNENNQYQQNNTTNNENDNNQYQQNATENEIKKEEDNSQNNSISIDDEIIDIDDEGNPPIVEEIVNVSEVINCDNCVFAYFSGEGENAKKLGDSLSSEEYTTDIRTLKTNGGKQRHNFFGLVLSGNTISKAYACILKNSKIYCIEGSTNGAYHNGNIGVLNQIFTTGQCKTISDGNTYTCTDGSYNGDTKTSGYTSMHYETSCTIYGANAKTGELICH